MFLREKVIFGTCSLDDKILSYVISLGFHLLLFFRYDPAEESTNTFYQDVNPRRGRRDVEQRFVFDSFNNINRGLAHMKI